MSRSAKTLALTIEVVAGIAACEDCRPDRVLVSSAKATERHRGTAMADRHVVQRTALVVGLGNYTHPATRHSIGQYVLPPLLECIQAHDARVRAHLARTVARLSPDAPRYELPAPTPVVPFTLSRGAKGWLAHACVLLDSLPPKGAAARRAPGFRADTCPYVHMHLILYIPRFLMNVNGLGVRAALAQLPELGINDTLLVHDELQRNFGQVAFKAGGSAAGHNGVRSVQDVLRCHGAARQEPEMARVRIGIGRPADGRVSEYVLGPMPPEWRAACVPPRSDPASEGAAQPAAPVLQAVWQHIQQWCLAHVVAT